MKSLSPTLKISTPGRVCLFGEHQDYLQLPVIPCAISLRIFVEGSHRPDRNVQIALPDISSGKEFSFDGPLGYAEDRDYFRSAVNVLRREGFTFSMGVDATVRGKIPINSGTSSSSALTVSWINFLTRMSDQRQELLAADIARLAHAAEVLEFNEPGGMMDHYATSYGGVIAIDFFPEVKVERFKHALKTFVLGDSLEPKDTKEILARVKEQVLAISRNLSSRHSEFSLHTVAVADLQKYRFGLTEEQLRLLTGTVRNRDLTRQARDIFRSPVLDHRMIGRLLSEHQAVLRDVLRISTPKIDRMIDAALAAGAYGAKINGSGGGGCMFAYVPEDPERVARAVERAGGKTFIVEPDTGTRVESTELAG